MSLSTIVALLQAALVLLTFVQGHAELPQSVRDNATEVAQQAITQATQALSQNPQSFLLNQTSISGSIDQDGQTLSLSTNPQLTGTITGNFDTAQIFAIPSPYTGPTDHQSVYSLYEQWRGYGLAEGQRPTDIQYVGSNIGDNGHWSEQLSLIVDASHKDYTLLLYGVPPNDTVDSTLKTADFNIAPTLLAIAHITITN